MCFPSVCRTEEGDAVIMHPGALCIMVQLLPRLYHHDHAQVRVTHGRPFSSWLGTWLSFAPLPSLPSAPCVSVSGAPRAKGRLRACDAPETLGESCPLPGPFRTQHFRVRGHLVKTAAKPDRAAMMAPSRGRSGR